MTDQLLSGPDHFIVEELPAYEPSGTGEHVYVLIEKRGLTTDAAVRILARAAGIKPRDVGFAGRKDRHAITRQWMSLHFGDQAALDGFAHAQDDAYVRVLTATRHSNKLRLGHLRGNTFQLGVQISDSVAIANQLAALAENGIPNAFGPQRFGMNHANLAVARAWASGDWTAAIEPLIDPHGEWHWGNPLPEGFIQGDHGRVIGALRQGRNPQSALKAAGKSFRQLIASAAQSAVFNAILTARMNAQLIRCARPGDAVMTPSGAVFEVDAAALDDVNRRLAERDLMITAPLPGERKLPVSHAVSAEEQDWSNYLQIDWEWFGSDGIFCSPGERRACLSYFLTAPTCVSLPGHTELHFTLPSGSYATQVLDLLGISIPSDRSQNN